MRTRQSGCGLFLVAACLVVFGASQPVPAHDAKPAWNQEKNVKDAAKRLGALQRREGSEAVLKFLEACYKTHMLSETYSQGLESCMAQDYMLSQMLAVIYSKVPPEQLAKMKAPAADVIAASMRGSFQAIFQQYKFSQEQADALKKAVDKHAMPVYVKIMFPKSSKRKEGGGKDVPDAGAPATGGAGKD